MEKWLPNYLDWWREMGPEGFQDKEVYLRTAVGVDAEGWANFDYVKMPDYRWGIFLKPAEADAKVGFGDNYGMPAYQEVPGEFRNALRRIIVTQGDTEPASVEQQRELGKTCPSLYDLRNLFQVNVEEGRHLWAMVYLLHGYFGRDGRDEADALLERRSGNPDKPRILEAFNQPCDDWLNFFCFTMFTDRDGKYQLAALAESGFEPLARTCQFMLTEEAHHLFVGETGVGRVVKRTAQLMKESKREWRRARARRHPARHPSEVHQLLVQLLAGPLRRRDQLELGGLLRRGAQGPLQGAGAVRRPRRGRGLLHARRWSRTGGSCRAKSPCETRSTKSCAASTSRTASAR